MCTWVQGPPEEGDTFSGTRVTGSCQMWVLGTKLWSTAGTVTALNPSEPSVQFLGLFWNNSIILLLAAFKLRLNWTVVSFCRTLIKLSLSFNVCQSDEVLVRGKLSGVGSPLPKIKKTCHCYSYIALHSLWRALLSWSTSANAREHTWRSFYITVVYWAILTVPKTRKQFIISITSKTDK